MSCKHKWIKFCLIPKLAWVQEGLPETEVLTISFLTDVGSGVTELFSFRALTRVLLGLKFGVYFLTLEGLSVNHSGFRHVIIQINKCKKGCINHREASGHQT